MSETTIDTRRYKVVFVGDCAVGKTCLLISFTENEFDEDHVPTVIDNRIQKVNYQEEQVILNLWDTAGQEDFDNLRLLSYPETDLFFVCFSVVSPSSLKSVKRLWMREISGTGKAFTPKVPCILVGTKSDLRQDERTLNDLKEIGEEPVSFEQAQEFAKENGFYAYRECSALTREGIEEVIMTGIESKFKQVVEVSSVATTGSKSSSVASTPNAEESVTQEVVAEEVKEETTQPSNNSTTPTSPESSSDEGQGEEANEGAATVVVQQQPDHNMWYPFIALLSMLKSCEIL